LLKWYGTNPNYETVDRYQGGRAKYVPLSLGLSNQHQQAPYLQYYLQRNRYRNPFLEKSRYTNPFLQQKKSSKWSFFRGGGGGSTTEPDNNKWLFVHFNVHEFARHRQSVYTRLCRGHHTSNSTSSSNTTEELSCRSSTQSVVSPEAIYSQSSEYLFGVSPPGVGWDCYRTYELLLVGVIPIIDGSRSGSRELFEGLPVVYVDHLTTGGLTGSWTRDSIYQQAKDYVLGEEFQTSNFTGWNKLFTRYWRRRILEETKRDNDFVQDDDGNEYYTAWRYTTKKRNRVSSKR